MNARIWLATAMAATVLSAAAASAAPVLVYGNMYDLVDPTQPAIGDSFSTIGPTTADKKVVASGFLSGTNHLQVTSVQLNIESLAGSQSGTMEIYASTGNSSMDVPTGSPIYTSSPVSVSGRNTYTFTFSGALLSPATAYWLIPQFASDFNWFRSTMVTLPPWQYTDDPYHYLKTWKSSTSTAGPWAVGGVLSASSFAVFATTPAAVPEIDPAGLGTVLGLICGGLGLVERRRLQGRVGI